MGEQGAYAGPGRCEDKLINRGREMRPLNPDFPGAAESKERWGLVHPPPTHPRLESTNLSSQIVEKGVKNCYEQMEHSKVNSVLETH